MDLTITKADLARELALLERVVPRRPVIPVLNGALARTEGAQLVLSATDTELALTTVCDVRANGMISTPQVLPVKRLSELVKTFADGDIKIEATEKGGVSLSAAGFRGRFQTVTSEDFPTLPTAGDVTWTEVPAAAMADALRHGAFSAADNDARHYINGAMIEFRDARVRVVSTDGYCLAMADVPAEGLDDAVGSVIVPTRACQAMAGLIGGDGVVRVAVSASHVFVACAPRELAFLPLSGEFPKYDRLIPETCGRVVTVPRTSLLTAVRRALLMGDTVSIGWTRDMVEVSAVGVDVGEAREQIPAEYAHDEAVSVKMRGKYAVEWLDLMSTETVTMEQAKDVFPIVWRTTHGTSSYLYLIMPMRSL